MNYNMEKLSSHIAEMADVRVLLLGNGAVGSLAAELMAKAGIGTIVFADMGKLTRDNAAKHSSMIRREDAGKYKSVACAERAEELMVAKEGHCYALVTNLQSLGPRFYEDFDYVIMALDNYAAKEYVNQTWRQVEEGKRPKLIIGGTIEENANVYFLSGNKLCFRCVCDESWLNGDVAKKRTSCTDGAQYRIGSDDVFEEHAPTSHLASMKCAEQMVDYIIASEKQMDNIDNTMTYHYPYPRHYDVLKLQAKKDCPDCRLSGPEKPVRLNGNMYQITLGQFKELVMKDLGDTHFSVLVHIYEWAGVVYSQFVSADYCRKCGKPTKVEKHEYSIQENEVLCEKCSGRIRHTDEREKIENEFITAFVFEDHRFDSRRMFELGYPIGAYLTVIHDGDAKYYTFEGDEYEEVSKLAQRKEFWV